MGSVEVAVYYALRSLSITLAAHQPGGKAENFLIDFLTRKTQNIPKEAELQLFGDLFSIL